MHILYICSSAPKSFSHQKFIRTSICLTPMHNRNIAHLIILSKAFMSLSKQPHSWGRRDSISQSTNQLTWPLKG